MITKVLTKPSRKGKQNGHWGYNIISQEKVVKSYKKEGGHARFNKILETM